MLEFSLDSQRPVAQIHPLPGIDLRESLITQPTFGFIVVQNLLNNIRFDLPLLELKREFQTAVLPSGEQSQRGGTRLVVLIFRI